MANVLSAGKTIGKNIFSFRRLLTYSFLTIIFFLIFANAISKSIEARSFEPLVTDIGGRFAYSTRELNRASLEVEENPRILDFSSGFFKGLWHGILVYSDLISSFSIIFLWIYLLAKLIGFSPFSDTSNVFRNYFMAIIIFFILQSMFLLATIAVEGNATGFTTGDNSIVYNLMLPFKAFGNFFRVIPILLSPFVRTIERFSDSPNMTSFNNSTSNITIS